MAEDKRYSIISVSSDEDEDVVIQAGVVDPAAAPVEPAASEPALRGAAQGRVFSACDQESDSDEGLDAATAEDAEAPAADDVPTDEERRREHRARARAAELERLNETERQLSEKTEQSGMHKAVLALFAVGVVACAVLYYVFFMA